MTGRERKKYPSAIGGRCPYKCLQPFILHLYKSLVEPDAIRLAYIHPVRDISTQVECSLEHATLSRYDQELIDHCHARHPIIHLGTSNHGASSLFDQFQALRHQRTPFVADSGLLPEDTTLQTLIDGIEARLLARPWFTRVWVYQELIQSRDPWVQCGEKRLKWDDLCRLSSLIRDRLFLQAPQPKSL